MQTSHSILLLVIYTFFNINPAAAHEALVIIQESVLSDYINFHLPREAEEFQDGHLLYPEIEKYKKLFHYLCPREPNVKSYLEGTAHMFPDDAYCLMKSDTSDCEREVKPLFTNIENGKRMSMGCGSSINHTLYHFGFNFCRYTPISLDNMRPVTSELFSLYDVCFDPDNSKTIWTRHNVQTESMLSVKFKSQQMTEEEATLSKDSFSLWNTDSFSKIAKKYKKQKPEPDSPQKPDSPHRMIPQQLVPKEDMALKLWKKTTTHYLNTAALWYKLEPLMIAINTGIRKIATTAQRKKVDIYTTTHSPFSLFWRFLNKAQSFLFRSSHTTDWNIWCKFIHVRAANQGIMIYLHNTPDNPPGDVNSTAENQSPIPADTRGDIDHASESSNPTATSSNLPSDVNPPPENPNAKRFPKECAMPVICDFKKWFQGQGYLSDELLKYAYCCKVDKDQVKTLFNVTLTSDLELLDIDGFYGK